MTESATIEIRVGGVEVTCRGPVDRGQLDDVLAALRQQLPELMRTTGGTAPDVAGLLASSAAKTFGEKAGVVAWWLEEHRGRREWRSGDIVDALREAGEPEPANITDALNQKLKKGLFEVNDRRWKLTGEGRGWVKYALLHQGEDEG
jgi:hypothetical protein